MRMHINTQTEASGISSSVVLEVFILLAISALEFIKTSFGSDGGKTQGIQNDS